MVGVPLNGIIFNDSVSHHLISKESSAHASICLESPLKDAGNYFKIIYFFLDFAEVKNLKC